MLEHLGKRVIFLKKAREGQKRAKYEKKKKQGKNGGKQKKTGALLTFLGKISKLRSHFVYYSLGVCFQGSFRDKIHPGMLFFSLKYDIFTNW